MVFSSGDPETDWRATSISEGRGQTQSGDQRGQDSLMVFSSGNSGERTGGRPRFRRVEARPVVRRSVASIRAIHADSLCERTCGWRQVPFRSGAR